MEVRTRKALGLVTLIGSGVLCGFLVSLFFLNFYGPTGQYTVKNILLSPLSIEQLSYEAPNPHTKKLMKFHFDRIDFFSFDIENNKWTIVEIKPADYALFFKEISEDQSILEVDKKIEEAFLDYPPDRLILMMKEKSDGKEHTMPFQELQIPLKGDYYRIELRDTRPGTEWAYFSRKSIRKKAVEILHTSSE